MRHDCAVDAELRRVEALPGAGRYAVTFRRADGSEQAAVVEVAGGDVTVAEASLPAGWTRTGGAFGAVAEAVLAFARARGAVPSGSVLRDVPGGWDVMLGNVVLDAGTPACTAHGAMTESAGTWSCAECGARALLG